MHINKKKESITSEYGVTLWLVYPHFTIDKCVWLKFTEASCRLNDVKVVNYKQTYNSDSFREGGIGRP